MTKQENDAFISCAKDAIKMVRKANMFACVIGAGLPHIKDSRALLSEIQAVSADPELMAQHKQVTELLNNDDTAVTLSVAKKIGKELQSSLADINASLDALGE